MSIEEVKDLINWLAKSQVDYWRLKNRLDVHNEWGEFINILDKNNIKDAVDLVMFLEYEQNNK